MRPSFARSGEFSSVAHVILISCLVALTALDVCEFGVRAAPPVAPPQQEPAVPVVEQKQESKELGGKSSPNAVESADQKLQQQQQQQQAQKTADLSPLINETLKINNKSTVDAPSAAPLAAGGKQQPFRDDWTFDRVEYDLMEFLQELNARYRQANKTENATLPASDQVVESPTSSLEERRDGPATPQQVVPTEGTITKKTINADCARDPPPSSTRGPAGELVSTSTIEEVKRELDRVAPQQSAAAEPTTEPKEKRPEIKSEVAPPTATSAPSPKPNLVTLPASSELPISLASGDHDISESTWQYGIFDRFTRPRSSTTTQSPDILVMSGTNSNLDVRSFNSQECGLRNYRVEPDYFPDLGPGGAAQLDTDEMTKELSQRRQRPPPGSSFFQSHKKYHLTASGEASLPYDSTRDELDREKFHDLPPYDRYGDPSSAPSSGEPAEQSNTSKYHKDKAASGSLGDDTQSVALGADNSPAGDSEFNLSLRRQWLQQQLGSTLQILGYNATNSNLNHQTMSDYFNQTHNMRENMMKMSASFGGPPSGAEPDRQRVVSKLAKSLVVPTPDEGQQQAQAELAPPVGSVSEQELKARQDELKLEARVIGGNDARLGDSPWSASLQALVSRPGTGGVEYRHYCGGTIISEYYILTAAHCLDFMVGRESRLFVVIGDLNWRMSAASLHGRRFGIEKLIIHGGYKSTAFGHDIGLIKTKESMKPLKVNGRYIINSVCLPERNVEHTGEAELVGWGLFSNRNEMADSLQIADVPILPRPLCVDLYRRRTGLIQWLIGIELITEKQICAGTFGRGICQGDSGSALVFNEKAPVQQIGQPVDGKAAIRLKSHITRDQQQRATIIGTVAFGGIRRCSYQSLPGVYMQTSKYLDWILPRIQV